MCMYRVYINDETNKDVRIQFQDAYEYLIDKGIEFKVSLRCFIDSFHDVINKFMEKYPNLKDNIDVLGDYDYYISCDNEDIAIEVENYFDDKFSEIEEIIEGVILDLELDEEYEEYEEEYI